MRNHSTLEMSAEVELRRHQFFARRIAYAARHMAAGEQALLKALVDGAPESYWRSIDAAIDREENRA